MKATPLPIREVILIEPELFADDRGSFFESFNLNDFETATQLRPDFVQDNQSVSRRGVVRGMHYQLAPHEQGKLVRVVRGAVFDVAVDIRRGSPTFGHWVGQTLSADNRRQLWIPPGFAHGFACLEEGSEVLYKATNFYDRPSEAGFRWDDPDVGIDWPFRESAILSDKDLGAPPFRQARLD